MKVLKPYFVCRFPNEDKQHYFVCEPTDIEQADMSWTSFEGEKQFYRRESVEKSQIASFPLPKCSIDQVPAQKEEYLQLVEKAVASITSSPIEKIVLSRFKYVDLNEDFQPLDFFEKMCDTFPAAFVYVFQSENECWLGASPELLLEQNNGMLHTVSLAGTRWNNQKKDWTAKEIEEQAWVTQYILETLSDISAQDIATKGPFNRKAGHLEHLCTEIYARTPKHGNVFAWADELHPTPAVCGYPRDISMEFILKNENYHREQYAGYIGLIDAKTSQFFVNLRCMKVYQNQAVLFAGGGITADSCPETEWDETEEKLRVLGDLIRK